MASADGPKPAEKQSIIITTTTTTTILVCQVCGESPSKTNYGALSCSSCRTFFRRNAFPTKGLIVCRYDGRCEVNMLTRKVCPGCRLTKCLAIGMNPDFIRKEDLSKKKRKSRLAKNQELPVVRIPQQSALVLPQATNRPHLTAADWTLIFNVIHAFDTFNPTAEVRRTMAMFTTASSSAVTPVQDASQSLQVMSSFHQSLRSFISSIPDFRILTPNEQCSLFQRNMLGLLCIGGMYFMRESGVFERPESELIVSPFYGSEIIQQAKLVCQQLNCDPVAFKLLLVALAFSSNCYMLNNRADINRDSLLLGTFRLLGSQNVYLELMWKYLLHTYDYHHSVQRFSTLVQQLLEILKLSFEMYENNQVHQNFIDHTIEQFQTSSATTDKSVVPLWGKK